MRAIVLIITLALSVPVFSQTTQQIRKLKLAASSLNKALMQKDSLILKSLLHEKLTYGHSNGWIETKRELIEDLYNGKLTYKKIAATAPVTKTSGNTAAARSTADIDAIMDGKLMSFKLKVLQVWLWENEHWVLFARQSVSVPKEK